MSILLFLFGLFVGSFLGVLVDRLPKKQNVIRGRSRCDRCKKELGLLDLVPVLSFLLLKGKCRHCGVKLSIFYPAIEICTGIVFVLTYNLLNLQFPILSFQLIYYLLIVSSFIVIFFTDLKYGIILDKIVLFASLVTFLWLIISQKPLIINHLFSGLGAFLFFIAISFIFYALTKKQGMGGGDIKLSFFLGLFLGFPAIVICLYIAFLTGAIYSIILILWKKKAFLKDSLPFGPFLLIGALISLFWTNQIYSLVLSLLGI